MLLRLGGGGGGGTRGYHFTVHTNCYSMHIMICCEVFFHLNDIKKYCQIDYQFPLFGDDVYQRPFQIHVLFCLSLSQRKDLSKRIARPISSKLDLMSNGDFKRFKHSNIQVEYAESSKEDLH